MALAALPTIALNASTAFRPNFLKSANLADHFFKTPSSFDVQPPPPLPPPEAPVIGSTFVEIVIERAVSIEKIVMQENSFQEFV